MPFGAFYHDKKQKFKQTDDRQHKQMGVGWKVGDTKWKLTDEINPLSSRREGQTF